MTEIRCAVECRSDESRRGPGRLVGTLLTYGERAGDRPERFAAGALRWSDDGIVLTDDHGGGTITRVLPEVRGRDVLIDALLPDTQRGRDVATLIRNGTYRGLSVEFRALADAFVAGLREIRAARLVKAAVVPDPAYTGSTVEVRKRGRGVEYGCRRGRSVAVRHRQGRRRSETGRARGDPGSVRLV